MCTTLVVQGDRSEQENACMLCMERGSSAVQCRAGGARLKRAGPRSSAAC